MVFFAFLLIIGGALALWLAFWVLIIIAALVQMGFKAVALRQAEARCPGIKARFEKIEAIREEGRAKIEAHKKRLRKLALEVGEIEYRRRRDYMNWVYRGSIGAAGS